MRHNCLSRSLKKEEVLQVPEIPVFIEEFFESHYCLPSKEEDNIVDEFEGILKTEDGENHGQLNWDCMDLEGFSVAEEGDSDKQQNFENTCSIIKQEEYSFLEDDEKSLSLNLSLNYQEILDEWSDRTPWADDSTSFLSANNAYTGEVPVMEEERRKREASVTRYREKRQTRLFSKKIRYQVRKLNADKRPRLKGRFVKRVPAEKIHN